MGLPGLNQLEHCTKQGLLCLAQGHKAVSSVLLEPTIPQSQVKHSTTEPLPSLIKSLYQTEKLHFYTYGA